MFPKRAVAAIFSTAVGLAFVFSFRTPDAPVAVRPSGQGSGSSNTSSPLPGTGSGTRGTSATPRPTASGSGGSGATTDPLRDGTVTGPVMDMRFGPVQVQVTIAGGRITDVTALELPTGGRSGRISSFVEPRLRSEVLTAQSANIDIVSGATYTSSAYAASLQSALDQARG
jgi:uncharacterized protein with FMN-binding domain